jgi:hypothetical protein
MNAAQHLIPPQSTTRPSGIRSVSSLRSQAALVRALLDELERVAPPSADDAVSEQLIEEIARLGCRCIEIASALPAVVDARGRTIGAAQGVARCA